MTSNLEDLNIVDRAVCEFEVCSGAILSRNMKCKIMGIGAWKDKSLWPVNYLLSVKEIKIFGVYLMNSYQALIQKNWNYRYLKFEQAVISWSSRTLDSLTQRIEIIRTFALSRVYYIAAILPLSKTLSKKFEKSMGRFLWFGSGRSLRVAISDLKLPGSRGGLNLTCLHTMSKALRLGQLLRLLKSGEKKCIGHVWFWIGQCLIDFLPDWQITHHASKPATYFVSLAELVADAQIQNVLPASGWRTVSNKVIYSKYVESFEDVKVELNASVGRY